MKRLTLTGLSILCLSLATTTNVRAESKIEHLIAPQISMHLHRNDVRSDITPFELVSRAYQGAYAMQGIPSFSTLLTAYSTRNITADDLVKAAIASEQLSPTAQTDRHYLHAVDRQLFSNRH